MLKGAISVVLLAFAIMLTASTMNVGLHDVISAWTKWDYYLVRDMRRTVVINPQKDAVLAPDSISVPIQGRGRSFPLWPGRRHVCAAAERDPAGRLHVRMPFVAASDRRPLRRVGQRADPEKSLRLRELP